MTIGDINSFVTLRTGADTNQYTAANRLISTNRWYHKIADMIVNAQADYIHDDYALVATEAIITKNLTANQAYVALGASDEILSIQRAEVTYDGTNWYPLTELAPGEVASSIATQTDKNNTFQTTSPYYKQVGLNVYLYPVPTSAVTNGLKLWVTREADEFTSAQVTTGTREPGFDETFHPMIAFGVALDWLIAKEPGSARTQLTSQELQDYELRLKRAYGGKNDDRKWRLSAGYVDYN